MSSMGTSLFQVENMGLARAYWYLIAGVVGLLTIFRTANYVQRRIRCVFSSPCVFASILIHPYIDAHYLCVFHYTWN